MRILLFFFVAKILIPDKKMYDFFRKQSIQRLDEKNIYRNAYLQYFYIEFKSFIDEEVAYIEQIYDFLENRPGRVNIPFFKRKQRNFAGEAVSKNLELFKTKRRIGEIDFHLSEIIRNDLLNDFIKFVNKGKSSHSMQIKTSIYETNPFLLTNKSHSIIEYVAFISSIQIFKYLLTCNVELHPSLWVYAIHGQNYELIHLLEEKNVPIDDTTYGQVIKETQKSHCYDITTYILNKYEKQLYFSVTEESLKYYNFVSLEDRIDDLLINVENNIFDLCKYDYIQLVSILIKNKDIYINKINQRELLSENNDLEEEDEDIYA